MSTEHVASVIIDNYNYGRFLRDAIDSALNQTWSSTQVIVVDDGSQDDSRDVIARFGDRVEAILKDNGGQASAFNAGFVRSRGDVVLFLDADDMLEPTAVARAMPLFADPDVVKVHWSLAVIDEDGRRTGERHPAVALPEGDRRVALLRTGPTTELGPPTSGNAWSRRFLEQVLPIPEELYRISADKHLLELAPFFGSVRRITDPQSRYRRHARNSQNTSTVEQRLRRELAFYEHYSAVLSEHCTRQGLTVDLDAWKRNSWWHRQERVIREIASLPLADGPLVLVDDGAWGAGPLEAWPRLPFLERDGRYWGQPSSDAHAICELERLRGVGASYLIFVWSSAWWLEHYAGLRDYVRSRFRCVLDNEHVVAFDLRAGHGTPPL